MKVNHCPNCGEELIPDAQFCSACGAKIKTQPRRRKQSQGNFLSRNPWVFIIGGLAILAVGIWGINNTSAPTAAAPTPTAVPQFSGSGLPYPGVIRANVADVKTDLDAGTAVVVDVRGDTYYEAGHIPGAISLPLVAIEQGDDSLPKDQMIYLYCT